MASWSRPSLKRQTDREPTLLSAVPWQRRKSAERQKERDRKRETGERDREREGKTEKENDLCPLVWNRAAFGQVQCTANDEVYLPVVAHSLFPNGLEWN